MPRRLWLSLGALALGAGLLATAQLAGAARGARHGGIFRVGSPGASVQVDPQLAYITTAWWLEDATAATLFTWSPRARLLPQVAARYTVSNRARTYVHRSTRLPVQRRCTGNRTQLLLRDQAPAEQTARLARG